jgi:hypothetical protein
VAKYLKKESTCPHPALAPSAFPVEDPGKVDDFRKEIGILSWADYLKLASKNLYDGAPIRMPGPDE